MSSKTLMNKKLLFWVFVAGFSLLFLGNNTSAATCVGTPTDCLTYYDTYANCSQSGCSFLCSQGATTWLGGTCDDLTYHETDPYGNCEYGSAGSCVWDGPNPGGTCIDNCVNQGTLEECENAANGQEWCLPGCSGTATSCSSFASNQASCQAQEGCSWDPCGYSGSGDWYLLWSNNCIITSNVNLNGNKLIITGGPGSLTIQGAQILHVSALYSTAGTTKTDIYLTNGGSIT